MRNQQGFPSSLSRLVCESQLHWNDLPGRGGPKRLPDFSSRSSEDSLSTWWFTKKCLTDFMPLCLDHCDSWMKGLRKNGGKFTTKSVIAAELQQPRNCGSNPVRDKKFLGAFAKFLKATIIQLLCPITFFPPRKSNHFFDYCGPGQATDDNVAHAHCLLEN